MKVFISIPMRGKTDDEITAAFVNTEAKLKEALGEETEFIDSRIVEFPAPDVGEEKAGIWYLGKSIQKLSEADIAYFCKGWKGARGCKIEHEVAVKYGLTVVEEGD